MFGFAGEREKSFIAFLKYILTWQQKNRTKALTSVGKLSDWPCKQRGGSSSKDWILNPFQALVLVQLDNGSVNHRCTKSRENLVFLKGNFML